MGNHGRRMLVDFELGSDVIEAERVPRSEILGRIRSSLSFLLLRQLKGDFQQLLIIASD